MSIPSSNGDIYVWQHHGCFIVGNPHTALESIEYLLPVDPVGRNPRAHTINIHPTSTTVFHLTPLGSLLTLVWNIRVFQLCMVGAHQHGSARF
jgi:hypothetical protein